jgi:pimeloyl-ACP methyl ester carboxylesterase
MMVNRHAPFTAQLSVRIDPERGGDVADAVSDVSKLRNRQSFHILVLVHGFNNTRAKAQENYDTFFTLLNDGLERHRFDIDTIAHFHWPSDPRLDWYFAQPFNPLSYPEALVKARRAAQHLAQFIASLPPPGAIPSSLKISLVGHSMGCRLILEMLQHFAPGRSPKFAVVGMLAAAVPINLVGHGGSLNPPTQAEPKFIKFHSSRDRILQHLFPLGQWRAYHQHVDGARIEPYYYAEAIGYLGNPSDFAESFPRPSNGHSQYWSDRRAAFKILKALDPTFSAQAEEWEIGGYAGPEPHQLGAYQLPG